MPTPPSLDRWRAPAAEPVADPAATEPTFDPPLVAEGPFEMDLYRKRDFVTEATKWYCVPAAMLTMINIMSKGAEHSKATQKGLYQLARSLSTKTLVGKGAEPIGWARGLEQLGYGGFEVGVHRSRRAAIQAAAKAIRMTGRPAGLLVWRGAHSWVMSGFRATADPAATDDFTVTHVYIEDVWYPYVSSIWGKSRPPDSLVPVGRAQGGLPQVAPPDPTLPGHGRPVRDHPARARRGAALTDAASRASESSRASVCIAMSGSSGIPPGARSRMNVCTEYRPWQ